ncbi:MAG: DUF3592 domain-containing protein [Phycicoccus sp.]
MTLTTGLWIVATVGALGAMLAGRDARRTARRLRRAVHAEGVVVATDWNSSQQCFPVVEFRTVDGRPTRAKADTATNWTRFTVGQRVGVRYDPAEPTWMTVDGVPTNRAVAALVASVFGVAAASAAGIAALLTF